MKLKTKGTRYEPTPEIIAHATKQIAPLSRFLDESRSEAEATLELERTLGNQHTGDVWRAELTITHENALFRAESSKVNLDHAITTIARDVERELKRARGKRRDLFRKGRAFVKSFFQGPENV